MRKKARILIVDDDRRMVRTLVDILKVKGFSAQGAHSGPEALEKVADSPFDCALLDIKMPQMNGVELQKAIKSIRPDLPVVLLTAYAVDKLTKEAMAEGALAVLNKPLDINLILSFFSSLRRECSIVIVDDDPHFCKTLGDILQMRNFKVTQVTDPGVAISSIKPDHQVVLLDMKLNGINGLDILKKIREQTPDLPVLLVTGYREEMASAMRTALKLNAYACLYKPLRKIRSQQMGKILSSPPSSKW